MSEFQWTCIGCGNVMSNYDHDKDGDVIENYYECECCGLSCITRYNTQTKHFSYVYTNEDGKVIKEKK